MAESTENGIKVRFPIGVKLIIIISFLVVISLGAITYLVNYFVSDDVRVTAESTNLDANTRSANAVSSSFTTMQSNALLLMDVISNVSSTSYVAQNSSMLYFEHNPDIAALIVLSKENFSYGNYDVRMVNNKFFMNNELDETSIEAFISTEQETMEKGFKGEITVLNATPFFEFGMVALVVPWSGSNRVDKEQANDVVVIISSSEFLVKTFGQSSTSTSFVINSRGDILVHPDFEAMRLRANVSDSPLLKIVREKNSENSENKRNTENMQVLFKDESGIEYFGAYQKITLGDMGVITTIPSNTVFENVRNTTRRNIYLGLAVLFIAVIFVWIWALSLSRPIVKLTEAADQIDEGDYDIQLQPKSRDEIGVLTQSFKKMSVGLAERERLQDSFSKFVNKAVAEKAAKGELELGGETKMCTVFFSDIRSFTAISEKLEPYEVVEFLNEYMTCMVDCVSKTQGSVDKYIGDSIMAVWGTPTTSGDPAIDALRCVRAALMMRHALMEFNVGRGGEKKPIIKIGCGINTGPVIAGQIGSTQKMEYTVIGDTVNFASRTESLNKPLHTDILITENTYELVKEYVLVEQMPSVTVKGKSEPVHLYAVINMPYVADIPGAGPDGPKTLEEVRRMLELDSPDLKTVNLDEEEKKYKIQG